MFAVPYFARNFSTTSLTVGGSVIGLTLTVISIPLAEIVMVGFRKIFLYQLLADPFTGSRYSVSLSSTNHTGKEIFRPEFRPVTAISSSSVEASACLISAIAMRSSFLTYTPVQPGQFPCVLRESRGLRKDTPTTRVGP